MHRASDHNGVIETKTCPKMSEFMYKSTTSGTNVLIGSTLWKKDHVYLRECLLYRILIECPGNNHEPWTMVSNTMPILPIYFQAWMVIRTSSGWIYWDGKAREAMKPTGPQAKGQRFNPPHYKHGFSRESWMMIVTIYSNILFVYHKKIINKSEALSCALVDHG